MKEWHSPACGLAPANRSLGIRSGTGRENEGSGSLHQPSAGQGCPLRILLSLHLYRPDRPCGRTQSQPPGRKARGRWQDAEQQHAGEPTLSPLHHVAGFVAGLGDPYDCLTEFEPFRRGGSTEHRQWEALSLRTSLGKGPSERGRSDGPAPVRCASSEFADIHMAGVPTGGAKSSGVCVLSGRETIRIHGSGLIQGWDLPR